MKGLSMGEWSLIARYLKQEASEGDLYQLHLLIDRKPALRETLEILGREIKAADNGTESFDADRALHKLDERLKKEKLI